MLSSNILRLGGKGSRWCCPLLIFVIFCEREGLCGGFGVNYGNGL